MSSPHTRQNGPVIYVLAYPVFEAASARRINAFRATHEPERAKLVPPHITLVFGVDDRHLRTVSDLVDQVAGDTSIFPVTFDTTTIAFDPFEKTHKLFLLCGTGRARIADVHDRLYDGAHRQELSASHPFAPHMTIASYADRADFERVDASAIGPLPITADLTALELVRLDRGRMTELKSVAFKR